jgi:hypothetical protein
MKQWQHTSETSKRLLHAFPSQHILAEVVRHGGYSVVHVFFFLKYPKEFNDSYVYKDSKKKFRPVPLKKN